MPNGAPHGELLHPIGVELVHPAGVVKHRHILQLAVCKVGNLQLEASLTIGEAGLQGRDRIEPHYIEFRDGVGRSEEPLAPAEVVTIALESDGYPAVLGLREHYEWRTIAVVP